MHLSMLRRTEGFTLAELLVVVTLVIAISAIAVPVFLSQKDKADSARLQADAASIAGVLNAAIAGGAYGIDGTLGGPDLVITSSSLAYDDQKISMVQGQLKIFPGVGVAAASAADGKIDPTTGNYCIEVSANGLWAYYTPSGGGSGTCAAAVVP